MRTLIHDLTKSDMMDALVYIRAEAETVLATYDPNAEIVRNYVGIGKGTTFTISHPLDLTLCKTAIRRALGRCGGWVSNGYRKAQHIASRLRFNRKVNRQKGL